MLNLLKFNRAGSCKEDRWENTGAKEKDCGADYFFCREWGGTFCVALIAVYILVHFTLLW